MTPLEIQLGTRLELELLDNSGEKMGNVYISQMLEIQSSNCIIISAPIFEARLVYISLEAQIRLTFLHYKYGLLGFTARVTGREFRGNIAVLIIKATSDLTNIQRRTHYRLECIADALVRRAESGMEISEAPQINACAKNISGSGVCLVTETPLPVGTEVEVVLSLADGIKARGIIVRSTDFEIKKVKCYELGLHFTNMSQKDQDKIIRYVFEQQRILLKKEPK